ncbi:MAG: NAD(P)/FAD-dependent oxidoreductase [Methanosarcinales archaeon]|nr:MAG: NAD(P)/FAD-dependent oxidoreductase [Methanosarcinales archaeon]
MTVAVIGAGLSGLCAGYKLSKRGIDVAIFEKSEIGGLLSSYHVNGYHIEKYYHHLFRSDETILKLISDLGLSSKLKWLKGTTGYYNNEKIYPLNTASEILQYPYLSLFEKAKLTLLVLRSKRKNIEDLDNITAKDFILTTAGKSVYENFFEPLLKSKFGDEKDTVSASWLLSRIKIRSDRSPGGERLGYMRGGFYLLVEAMLKEIEDEGGEIKKTPVNKLIIKNNKVIGIETGNKFISCDNIISTASPIVLNKIAGTSLKEGIKYQGTACATFALKERLMENLYWLNIKADLPFGAVIEHTNFAPFDDYGEHLVYVTSYFNDLNSPLWKMNEEEVIKLYLGGLKKLFSGFDESMIKWWKLTRNVDTAPIFKTGFRNKVLPYKTKIRGLYLAGMFSLPNYPERSMNGSINAGSECVGKILEDEFAEGKKC